MRFTRGDVRDISFHPESIMDLRSSAEKRRSSREAQRSTLARFLGSFDFRLFQQYRSKAALKVLKCDFRSAPSHGHRPVASPFADLTRSRVDADEESRSHAKREFLCSFQDGGDGDGWGNTFHAFIGRHSPLPPPGPCR